MRIPRLARYNGTVSKAYKFVEENITEFPIDLLELIKKFNWGLLTYEQMALDNNCSIDDICECLGTDGYSIYNGHNYTIAYNNKIKSKGRINFTLAHEIGHIILGHHRDFDVTSTLGNNLTKEEYKILENEANCFARNLLAPAPLVKLMSFWNILFEMPTYFEITLKATTTRRCFLTNDLQYLTDFQIENMQKHFQMYKICPLCGKHSIDLSNMYCHNCDTKLLKGDGFKMKEYKGVETFDECPTCENSAINPFDKYCIICGSLLNNSCSNINCAIELPNNARFCGKCGSQSTFYNRKILNDWDKSEYIIVNNPSDDLPF